MIGTVGKHIKCSSRPLLCTQDSSIVRYCNIALSFLSEVKFQEVKLTLFALIHDEIQNLGNNLYLK